MTHHLVVNRFPRLHELVRDLVGLNDVRTQGGKHLAHHGLTHGDAPGQTDFKHSGHAPQPGRACAIPSASLPL